MKVETDLPASCHSFEYVKNSHYIKLTDDDGNATKLVATSLRRGSCKTCHAVVYMESNHGSGRCPTCGGEIAWQWGSLQLCFVPEQPSNFVGPLQKKV